MNTSYFITCVQIAFDVYMSYRLFGLKIQLTVTHDIIAVWTAVCYVYHVT